MTAPAARTGAGEIAGHRAALRTLVFVRRARQVLLVRRAPDRDRWPGCYNGVGGDVEPGEEIVSAARREVLEESGLRLRSLRLAGVIHVAAATEAQATLVLVFAARAEAGPLQASSEGVPRWVDLPVSSGPDVMPDLPALLRRVDWSRRAAPFVAESRAGREGEIRFAGEKPDAADAGRRSRRFDERDTAS